MNGKVAKKIRKQIYKDKDYRDRQYYMYDKSGKIIADEKRTFYKRIKKAHNNI